jgi:hypothetical protein
MQTINSQKRQPPPLAIRILLPIASIGSVVVGLLSLSGVPLGFACLIPFGLMYLLLYIWRHLEQSQSKKKPLAERVDQGRRAAKPGG